MLYHAVRAGALARLRKTGAPGHEQCRGREMPCEGCETRAVDQQAKLTVSHSVPCTNWVLGTLVLGVRPGNISCAHTATCAVASQPRSPRRVVSISVSDARGPRGATTHRNDSHGSKPRSRRLSRYAGSSAASSGCGRAMTSAMISLPPRRSTVRLPVSIAVWTAATSPRTMIVT